MKGFLQYTLGGRRGVYGQLAAALIAMPLLGSVPAMVNGAEHEHSDPAGPSMRVAVDQPAETTVDTKAPAARYFTDTELVDQNGEKHRFYTDLLQGQVVIINTFYTSCTEVCPVTMGIAKRIQDHLQDRMNKGVRILSFTVDPETDTPERLQDYAKNIGAGDGWYLLTGDTKDLDLVLRKIGQYTEQPAGHTNILILGNERTGLWKKAFALSKFEELQGIVDSVVNDKGASGS